MPDEPLSHPDPRALAAATPEEIAEVLSYVLRYDLRGKARRGRWDFAAELAAERLAEHVRRSGFVQAMNRRMRKIRVGRAGAKTPRRLQRVLKTNGNMPPIEHDCGGRQRLALQPPQPGITIAKHRRGVSACTPAAVSARANASAEAAWPLRAKAKAVLGVAGVDHLARDHLEMALLLAEPAAHVATVKSDHHSAARRRHGPLRRLGGVLAHDFIAHPLRPVSDGTGVLRPIDRHQLRQQDRNLAERRQRGISGRDVGQLRCDPIMTEILYAEALYLNRSLTRTDKQALDPYRHIAEQRAKRSRGAALASQLVSARRATATAFTHHGHLRRHDLGLKRRG
jgi:hypothetical protein